MLEAKSGRFPTSENVLHTYDDIENTRKVLQAKGLIVAIKNSDGVMCDMIPDDIAQCIRKYYNIEIRAYGYEKLVDYVIKKTKKQYLIDIVNKASQYFSKAKIEISNNIIEKDLQCEHLFEDATNFLFEKMLLNKPLTLTGSEHPDGKLSFKDKYIMWDNKSKETAVNLKDHIQQFERYIKTSDKEVVVFMVIAPSFTVQSVQECVDFSLNNDTLILLITAEELKTVAVTWAKKHSGEIFNLGYFKHNGRFDIKLLNL